MVDTKLFKKKHNRYFQMLLLSFLSGKVPRRYIPDLRLDPDGADCFTDHSKIVLGLQQERYDTEPKLHGFTEYVLLHESGHILHTPSKPWMWGIGEGIHYVITYFMKQYGYPVVRLMGENAMRNALKRIHDDGHKVPTYNAISSWVHFYINANEDGREEQCLMNEYPGMKDVIKLFRYEMWLANAEEAKNYPLSAADKLSLYGNEVLSLATTGWFEKNFWTLYGGTDEEQFLSEKIRPWVARSVYARKCKDGVTASLEIVKLLTPTFFEATQEAPDMFWLEEFLKELLQIISVMDPSDGSEIQEKDEKKNDGEGQSVFGSTVLGKPKLDKDGKKTGEISDDFDRNSFPKKEEKEKSEEDGEGKGNASGKDGSEEKSGEESGTGSSGDKSESNGAEGKSGGAGNDSEKDGEEKGSGDKSKDKSDSESSDEKSKSERSKDVGGGDQKNKRKEGSQSAGSYTGEFSEDELFKEMEEAAQRIADDYSESEGNRVVGDYAPYDEVFDSSSSAAEAAEMHKIKFVENQRQYTLDIDLPFVIQERGRILKEKVKRVFKPRKTKFYRQRHDGSIDAGKLFSAAMGEADFFKVQMKPDKRSCCAYILQDNSGSMGGGRNSKRMFASEASAEIEYAFKDFMPLKIVAFDERGAVVHEVIKNWNDKSDKSMSYNFFWKGREGGGNNDADSVAIATEELLKRKERDKILIIISDGLPCSSYAYPGKRPETAVKMAVERARACGIKVVGIYIEETVNLGIRNEYDEMYGHACVFTDTDHIAEELGNIMSGWVLKG